MIDFTTDEHHHWTARLGSAVVTIGLADSDPLLNPPITIIAERRVSRLVAPCDFTSCPDGLPARMDVACDRKCPYCYPQEVAVAKVTDSGDTLAKLPEVVRRFRQVLRDNPSLQPHASAFVGRPWLLGNRVLD
jgi:hypothetical protein